MPASFTPNWACSTAVLRLRGAFGEGHVDLPKEKLDSEQAISGSHLQLRIPIMFHWREPPAIRETRRWRQPKDSANAWGTSKSRCSELQILQTVPDPNAPAQNGHHVQTQLIDRTRLDSSFEPW